MQFRNFACLVAVSLSIALLSGCVSQQQYDELKIRNRAQQDRIDQLESQLNVAKLKLAQLEKQLADAQLGLDADVEALTKQIEVLKEDIAQKEEMIKQLQAALGGSVLPPELTSELQKFAAENPEMVSFDEATGMVKFKSDLTFKPGSDTVEADAITMMKKLCTIINSPAASGFDIKIVGHTDDMPIRYSANQHPTNWHLSVHRAISVEKILETEGVSPSRMSVQGYSEYKPVAPNEPANKGNAMNRRVEIYLIPSGSVK
ncbi:MAG: putative lipoprotein YiaD precursor [Planctomycetes bacterium ADurb.Bin401]|nr:MAG: putative lipoprotein YiaD precursor [Planctomycetes bacterium ADurb.Bin401]